jgi:hypothetical protein
MSAMHELPLFQQQQYAFAAHIRDPEGALHPADVDGRRMAVYCELFYNNIEGVLSNAFPVVRSLYCDDDWHALVHSFFRTHHARTPYLTELPQTFLHHLQYERESEPSDPDFLLELAHYEWVEMALSIAEEEADSSAINPEGDVMNGIPVLSSLAWQLVYRYPVHRIGPDYRPDEPPGQPTHLVVYRDRNDEIGFLELNPVTARLLQLMSDNQNQTGSELLHRVSGELNHPNPQAVLQGGQQIFAELQQRGVLFGTRQA